MPDPLPKAAPLHKDLMAQLGWLLLWWINVEREIEIAIRDLKPLAPSLQRGDDASLGTPKLREWHSLHQAASKHHDKHMADVEELFGRLDSARKIRNHIAHHLVGASVDPQQGEAGVACILDNGEVEKIRRGRGKRPAASQIIYSYSALRQAVADLESGVMEIRRLTFAALEFSNRRPAAYGGRTMATTPDSFSE